MQPWKYYVIVNEEKKRRLVQAAYGQEFIVESGCVIVVCIDTIQSSVRYGARGRNLYAIQDTAAAIQNMLLMVHSLGLGCCWIGAFEESKVMKVLGLEGHLQPVAILPIGYPAEQPEPTPRKSLESVVEWVR
jgi:nitroreductase